jgi:Pregnancy-associated plasma protein-A/Secretion system C-terminal sorting domain
MANGPLDDFSGLFCCKKAYFFSADAKRYIFVTLKFTALEKFTFKHLLTTLTVLLLSGVSAMAQKQGAHDHKRCATVEYHNQLMAADPTAAARWKAEGDQKYNEYLANQANGPATGTNANAFTMIPVVVHVVGTAAQQAFASDAMIQRQIDVLNLDFGGTNPDSVKIPALWKPLFGHANFRFCLAKRTPAGAATNGIERRVNPLTITAGTMANIKQFSTGGLDQWDGNKYLNIWLGIFSDGTLGIATFPNTGAANLQGVVADIGSIDQPCGSSFPGEYDRGRTLTHEVGHYFYLFHIWGDDGSACTGNDWGTQYGALPACTDDTQNAGGPTFGCPTGVLADACATAAVGGKMYQNYMDYTDDACMVMFTNGQICRATGCLDIHRASLKTSDGCTPVGPPVTDVRVSEVLNPISRGFACGASTSYCAVFAPQVLIQNDGDAPLTSVVIDSKVDGVVTNTFNWTGTLAPGENTYVTLGFVNSSGGAHVLTVKTRDPNGVADGRPNNDSANARFNQSGGAGVALPISDGFESTTFPPAGYSLVNPDNARTWARTTAAARTGVASMFMDAYNYTTANAIDLFRTPTLNTSTADVVRIKFDVAYARYSATAVDRLEVVYSTDCGLTYLPTGYNKSQLTLATNGGGTVLGTFVPTAAQWRTDSVDINVGCGSPTPSMIIALRFTNQFGNQCYIDNFSVTSIAGTSLDAKAASLSPIASPICPGATGTGTIAPTFSFTNQGTTTLTSATINYKLDNGTVQSFPWSGSLAKCATTSVTLPSIAVTGGNRTLKVYTTLPNGSADLAPANDTATAAFYVQEVLPTPSTQSFEATTFPPANGWGLSNPDNATTWARSTLAAKTGVASMRIDAYNYTAIDQLDILSTPNIALGGLDTLTLDFQVAYAQFSAASGDTLDVLYSTDCGVTWLPTGYKKGGQDLKTTTAQFVTAAFVPTATQWRKETIIINTCNFTAPSIMFGFRFKNNYGNNCYIDDIITSGVTTRQYNAAALKIASPVATICGASDGTFTPKVTIGNFGSANANNLTSVVINYRVDNGPVTSFNWTGSLARCATTEVTLNPVTASKGSHVFTVYTTLPNANADQFRFNDTASVPFIVSPTVSMPIAEGFENTTFPGTDFGVQNLDNLNTFVRATGNARTGTGAMVMRNFNYPAGASSTEDRFLSPVVANSATNDSVFVSFDYAYLQGAQYPGSTVKPLDTLELMVTTDCGATFRTIWKQWGEDLQTVSDPNYSTVFAFAPNNAAAWRNVRIYLTPFVGSNNFQVYWVNKGNRQNDLWMDNINITSKTLPARLKNQGYLIYPNPFENSFRIHHWVAPQDLKAAQIFNAAGQLVWDKRYSGNADTEISVDMSRLARGTYTLKMTYSSKVVVERIVKLK